ncbi:uncharacterized protein LOC133176394 [Saccostrea echinata]|uniref:uncharacterized protein LOC133176394 n=1 Tax=Saccostrea echinata TaxID=191078 RepID=UPI002A80025C|nr:uncharacterized protein LOC133176394 [Saccostrea echinata]
MSTAIEKLKVKGAPAPRNTPASSPVMATSRANRPMVTSTILTLDKSYEIILKQTSRHSLELAAAGMSAASRRMEYLGRLQHANFGISTMDSPFIVCEDSVIEEKPFFVLCGQPVNGVSAKSLEKYLSENRTGNFKTSAHEMYKVRHGVKTAKVRTEPPFLVSRARRAKSDLLDYSSHRSDVHVVPSSAVSRKPLSESNSNATPIELTTKSFKGVNESEKLSSHPRSADYMAFRPIKSSTKMMTRHEMTEKIIKDHESGKALLTCIHVNHHTPGNIRNHEDDENLPSHSKAFSSHNGLRTFNNPYRNLKHRENVIMKDRKTDMKSVRKIAKLPPDLHMTQSGKQITLPKNILRVPNPCSDTFVLQMLVTANNPKVYHPPLPRTSSGKYSDIALQRDLDDYVQVRTPSIPPKSPAVPIKSPEQKAVKSGKSNHVVEDEGDWAGDVDDGAQ